VEGIEERKEADKKVWTSFYIDSIKERAKIRHKLGLKTHIIIRNQIRKNSKKGGARVTIYVRV